MEAKGATTTLGMKTETPIVNCGWGTEERGWMLAMTSGEGELNEVLTDADSKHHCPVPWQKGGSAFVYPTPPTPVVLPTSMPRLAPRYRW